MSGMFARMVAQSVMLGINIVTKTFQQAYAKAQAGGASAAKSAMSGSRMPLDQARQILNLEKNEVTVEKITEQFNKYYLMNDPDKGGSFYLQAKIHFAKEALTADLKKKQSKENNNNDDDNESSSSETSSSSSKKKNEMK